MPTEAQPSGAAGPPGTAGQGRAGHPQAVRTRGAASTGAVPSGPRRDRRGRWRAPLLMLAPFTLLFLCFYLVPVGYAVYQSLFGLERTSAYGAPHSIFVGLDNYLSVLTDHTFLASVGHVLLFGIGPMPLLVIVALALALLLDARVPGRVTTFFRVTAFVPHAVPAVIGAILWGFLYTPGTSPIVSMFDAVGLHLTMLSSGNIQWAVGNITIWIYAGYNMMIFLAALQAIDPALYETARVDGAGGLRIALHVKLPLIRPAIVLSLVFNIIGTLQLFTEPMVLRGASSAIPSTWSPNMLAFAQTASNNYSYAAAMSVVLAVAAGILSFVLMRLVWRPAS